MDKLVSVVSTVKITKERRDEDRADRLNAHYTVVILVTFIVVVSANIYVGEPITCWMPAEFHKSHIKYANSYCWVRNTYYLPWDENIPRPIESRENKVIPYYQWVPFILFIQALGFFFPSIIWHGLNDKAGVDADNILEGARTFEMLKKSEVKDKTLIFIARQIMRFLQGRKQYSGFSLDPKQMLGATVCRFCNRKQGNYLVFLYIFVKLLYLANCVAQVFFLNFALGNDYHMYGVKFLNAVFFTRIDQWDAVSTYFPRVTMCDVQVRRLGNVQRYSLQCVLPINMFTEKIYMFLWFWIIIVFFLTLISLLMWIFRILLPFQRYSYLSKHLENTDRVKNRANDIQVQDFVFKFCKQDGAFLIHLIEHNTSDITATEVVGGLWDQWRDHETKNKRRERRRDEDIELSPILS